MDFPPEKGKKNIPTDKPMQYSWLEQRNLLINLRRVFLSIEWQKHRLVYICTVCCTLASDQAK
jgi:hypothetical protein